MPVADIDIVQVISANVRLYGTRGELRGKCPFHQGKTDASLVVWPDEGRWRCWAGCGSGDAIDWVCKRDGIGYRAALERLGLEQQAALAAPAPLTAPEPAMPPSEEWQQRSMAFVHETIATLWSPEGRKPLAWLASRGFMEATVWAASLGYNPADQYAARAEWGLPSKPWTDDQGVAHTGERLALPRGIVIPWFVGDALWRVFIRTPQHPGPGGKPWPKYHQLPGGANAIYHSDALTPHRPAILCEAAFDALAVTQEAGDLIAAVATGTTGGRSVTWLSKLALCRPVLLAFDNDAGGEPPLTYWRGVLPDARVWRPTFDDPAAMLEHGMDVRGWIEAGLEAE